MAQLVKCLIQGFGSGHDFTGREIKFHVWFCAQQSLLEILSISLPTPSNKQTKLKKKKCWYQVLTPCQLYWNTPHPFIYILSMAGFILQRWSSCDIRFTKPKIFAP